MAIIFCNCLIMCMDLKLVGLVNMRRRLISPVIEENRVGITPTYYLFINNLKWSLANYCYYNKLQTQESEVIDGSLSQIFNLYACTYILYTIYSTIYYTYCIL